MPTICFAYTVGSYRDVAPDPTADPIFDRFMRGRADVYSRLRAFGFDVVISVDGRRSFVQYSNETYVNGFIATDAALPGAPLRLPLSEVDIVVNRTSKILDLANVKVMVNDAATYSYGNDKLKTYRDLLAPNDLGIPTLPLDSSEDIDIALDEFGDGQVVLKKVMGSMSDGLHIVDSPAARRLVKNCVIGSLGSYIVQPRYDFAMPWPAEIASASEVELSLGESLQKPHRPKELRAFIFANAGRAGDLEIDCYPVGRFGNEEATHLTPEPLGCRWLALEPETVPLHIFESSRTAIRTLGRATGSRAIYGCIDWGYGTAHGSQDPPGWAIIEVNLCGPRLFEVDRFPKIGGILHTKYVDFLRRAAVTA